MTYINLVNSYLTYELLFNKEESSRTGPVFITYWVQNYLKHKGVMEFNKEVFYPENFPYLLSFGRENDSINTLIFNENFNFALDTEKSVSQVYQVFSTFNKESITSITLRGNLLGDQGMKQVLATIN